MATCSSVPKLDVSTLDPSKPIPVGAIILSITEFPNDNNVFYRKYGGSLRNDPDKLETKDLEKLLEILCGTVAANWESIVNRVKAETGLTLDGDAFLQDMESGDITRIINLKSEGYPTTGYSYSWDLIDHEFPEVVIRLTVNSFSSAVTPAYAFIITGDVDALGVVTNQRMASISLR
jgi:hypothetical protein